MGGDRLSDDVPEFFQCTTKLRNRQSVLPQICIARSNKNEEIPSRKPRWRSTNIH